MSRVQSYRDLIVWQRAIEFTEMVYQVTSSFPKHELYGLTNQLRRSAVSVPSNIAEGQARQHAKEFRHFLHIAKGSLAEAHTQLIIASRLHYLPSDKLRKLESIIVEIQKMLRALIARLF